MSAVDSVRRLRESRWWVLLVRPLPFLAVSLLVARLLVSPVVAAAIVVTVIGTLLLGGLAIGWWHWRTRTVRLLTADTPTQELV